MKFGGKFFSNKIFVTLAREGLPSFFPSCPDPVVEKVDSAIRWINLYPVDSAIGFPNTYPLDSDLSSG